MPVKASSNLSNNQLRELLVQFPVPTALGHHHTTTQITHNYSTQGHTRLTTLCWTNHSLSYIYIYYILALGTQRGSPKCDMTGLIRLSEGIFPTYTLRAPGWLYRLHAWVHWTAANPTVKIVQLASRW